MCRPWPVVKCDLEQDSLHSYHDEGLDQERFIELRTGVVEYPRIESGRVSAMQGTNRASAFFFPPKKPLSPQQRRHDHDQGYVQTESSVALLAVHREGLVAVRQNGRQDEE